MGAESNLKQVSQVHLCQIKEETRVALRGQSAMNPTFDWMLKFSQVLVQVDLSVISRLKCYEKNCWSLGGTLFIQEKIF